MVEMVAELSSNHGGDKAKALALIEAAASSGADTVKFQTWTPDTLAVPGVTLRGGREPLRRRQSASPGWNPLPS